jgi:hypothetical protein
MFNTNLNPEIIPDFFIVGAGKAGTTAMSEYLRTHPEICFASPKEPNYFNTDFSEQYRQWANRKNYKDCFPCADKRKVLGEGTVTYLFSKVAVNNIIAHKPDAKFVVMIRNPIDLAQSMHAQLIRSAHEDVDDFKKAWNLQSRRVKGLSLPRGNHDIKLTQYGKFCKLGSQLNELLKKVNKNQVHVIVFDDFIKNTRSEYMALLDFLDLDYDRRTKFPQLNTRKYIRSKRLQYFFSHFTNEMYSFVAPVSEWLKQKIGIEKWGIIYFLQKSNFTEDGKISLIDPDFEKELQEYFREDVQLLSHLLRRDLTHWLN